MNKTTEYSARAKLESKTSVIGQVTKICVVNYLFDTPTISQLNDNLNLFFV